MINLVNADDRWFNSKLWRSVEYTELGSGAILNSEKLLKPKCIYSTHTKNEKYVLKAKKRIL